MKKINLLFPDPIYEELQRMARSAGVDATQFCSSLILDRIFKKSHDINSTNEVGNSRERETVKQVFAVFGYFYKQRLSFNEAIRQVGVDFNVQSTTVRDKCTRRISFPGTPMDTNGFVKLLKNPKALRNHLCTRFPNEVVEINSHVDQMMAHVGRSTKTSDERNPKRFQMLEFVQWVVTCLRDEFNGRATKLEVEKRLIEIYAGELEHPFWHEPVGAQPDKGFKGVPRWMKSVEFARNLAKDIGLIKSPEESGRGIWELTEKGKSWSRK